MALPVTNGIATVAMTVDGPAVFKTEEAGSWQQALDNAIPAIVVIRVCGVRPFDGNGANYSFATGFVVSKSEGIILTNRHVITAGPVTADAIFLNKEEVDLQPLYRDPVHDFGFFRFNPSDLKYQRLTEIPLDPDGARVGREIRVVGNDNGEKLSILPGILARTDREAPFYGSNDYNDFNTFYLAAASSNSGGSSGSPVLTVEGKAIALNCGAAKKAASSFYLPLHRIKRALDLLVAGQPVPRGTLQTVFKHMAFDEVRRLGLTTQVESEVRERFPAETGMLVVEQVIPKGPADGHLEAGDVLIELNGLRCTTFLPLAECFDSHVNKPVKLRLQRGGEERVVDLTVEDLHSIIPDEFFQVSSGVVHPLSYHHAKNYNLPVGGVYMASSGYMLARAGINIHCIITSIGGRPTPTLDAFQEVLESYPDGARTSLQYYGLSDRNRIRTGIITVDRKWFPMGRSKRTDPTWQFTPARDPPPSLPTPESRKRRRLSSSSSTGSLQQAITAPAAAPLVTCPSPSSSAGSGVGLDLEEKVDGLPLRNALVMVTFDVPYMVNGICSSEYVGAGVVFDKENGLVLVDRATVPMALGDVMVTVGGTVEVPGEVLFVHPVHNFSVVKYDPAALDAHHVDVSEASFSERRLRVGDSTTFYGLTTPFVPVYQRAVVTKLEILKLLDGRPPQYVAANTEVLFFDRVASCTGGVFEGPDGLVAALWLCFAYQHDGEVKQVYRGVPVEIVRDTVASLKGLQSVPRSIRALPVKFSTVELAKARAGLGLSEQIFLQMQARCRSSHCESSLLLVRRLAAGSRASQSLKTGDVVLSVEGQVVLRPFEVEAACRGRKAVRMTLLRNHEEQEVEVTLDDLDTLGTSRVLLWSGLFLQEPHLPALLMGYVPEEGGGVYISRWSYGSPAQKHGLRATMWVVEVNGTPTPDLDTFLAVTGKIGDHVATRLKTKDLDGKTKVFTLRPSYEYWPTLEVRWRPEDRRWELKQHGCSSTDHANGNSKRLALAN